MIADTRKLEIKIQASCILPIQPTKYLGEHINTRLSPVPQVNFILSKSIAELITLRPILKNRYPSQSETPLLQAVNSASDHLWLRHMVWRLFHPTWAASSMKKQSVYLVDVSLCAILRKDMNTLDEFSYHQLLSEFPKITRPYGRVPIVKPATKHSIEMSPGPPVARKPPVSHPITAHKQFETMVQLGTICSSSSG